jgi:hypothetical protein
LADTTDDAVKQLLRTFADMMVQTTALQYALVENGVLTWDQISAQFDLLNEAPHIKAFRQAVEAGSADIQALLRKPYREPIQ